MNSLIRFLVAIPLALVITTPIVSAQPTESEEAAILEGEYPEGVEARGFKVLGCDIGPDLNKVRRCIEGKLNKRVKAAKRSLEGQVKKAQDQAKATAKQFEDAKKNLNRQLDAAKKNAASAKTRLEGEVRKAKKNASGLTAQLERTRKNLEGQARNAQKQFDKTKKSLEGQVQTARKQLEQTTKKLNADVNRLKSEAERAAKDLANNPFIAALEPEKQALLAARAISGQLQPLFECFAQSGDSPFDIAALSREFARNPAGVPQELMGQMWDAAEGDFGQLMREELALLSQGSATPVDAVALFNRSLAKFERMASHHPGGRCLAEVVNNQLRGAGNTAVQLQRMLEARARSLIEQHIQPTLEAATANSLGQLYSRAMGGTQTRAIEDYVLSRDEVADIAHAVYLRHVVNDMNAGSEKIQALACSLDDPAQRTDRLADLHSALDIERLRSDAVFIDFGMEILRGMGHKYLDSQTPLGGATMVHFGVGVLQLAEDSVVNVVVGLCGLIPEVGAGICAAVGEVADAIWNQGIIPASESGINKALHVGHDSFIDAAKDQMMAGNNVRGNGPLAELARAFPGREAVIQFATLKLDDVQDAVEMYDRSVLMLADAQCELRDVAEIQ